MMNGITTEGDIMSVLGSAMLPIIVAAVTLGLKKMIVTALESPTDGVEQSIIMLPNVMNGTDLPGNEETLAI
jgi:hypothetical protein